MTKRSSFIKKMVSLLFVILLFLGFIKNGSYNTTYSIGFYLNQDNYDAENALSLDAVDSEYAAGMWKHDDLINLNGFMAKELNMHGLYSDMDMYVTDDRYIVSASAYTTTDYEVKQTLALRDFLEKNGISLLYVNEPTKYIDDEMFEREFGIETYSNRNMDLFLDRIREKGVNTIDLRDTIKEDGLDVSDLFYRTDHHWTVPAGLWAAKRMTEGLNQYCGYHIDTSLLDEENFDKTEWKECWLGEQGRKVAQTYVGLDDFTELKPNFETSFAVYNATSGTVSNETFDIFVNEDVYDTEADVYENGSWHYSYNAVGCINNNVEEGKVLLLGDSYDMVTQPFLSLQVRQVDMLLRRAQGEDFNLKDYILNNGYDTVIIAYAQFMVGAHDDPSNANYLMFDFN